MASGLIACVLFCFCFCLGKEVQGRLVASAATQIKNQAAAKPAWERVVGAHAEQYAEVIKEYGEFYGAKATLSINSLPDLESNQTSASLIRVSKAYPDSPTKMDAYNVLAAGWHVSPEIYGDTFTRFFTYWTIDSDSKTGCYNLLCSGFVPQSGAPLAPGHIFTIHDQSEQTITLTIYKDDDGNWWLYYKDSEHIDTDVAIGYWPKTIFTSLAIKANAIEYGGYIRYLENTAAPPMGTGHLIGDGAAFVKDMQYMKTDGGFVDITPQDNIFVSSSTPSCFNASLRYSGDDLFLDYGGPAGCVQPPS